jgi:hypothetical protein
MVDAAGSNQTPKVSTSSFAWNANTASLGIGTATPAYKLDIVGSIARIANAGTAEFIARNSTLSTNWEFGVDGSGNGFIYSGQASPMVFSTSGTERMRINASGNVGINTTPAAWSSSYRALQINAVGAVASDAYTVSLSNNVYWNGSANIYTTTGTAALYYMNSGNHVWGSAVSGTGGATASISSAMTLDASGRLLIGGTAADGILTLGNSSYGTSAIWQTARNNGNVLLMGIESSAGGSIISASSSGYAAVINSQNAYPLILGTNNTERMRIDSAGNVGIGTASPAVKFQINATGTAGFSFDPSNTAIASTFGVGGHLLLRAQVTGNTGGGQIFLGGSARGDSLINSVAFSTADTERMRINSSGNVSIGSTIDGGAKAYISGFLRVGGVTAGAGIDQTGTIALGNDTQTTTYGDNGIFRGGVGTVGGGNFTNISSYEGLVFNVGAAGFGSQTTRMLLTSTTITTSLPLLLSGGMEIVKTTTLSGDYTSGTWYPVATGNDLGTGTFIMDAFVNTYSASGSVYYMYYSSVPFKMYNVGSNSGSTFELPTMFGTGHANNGIAAPPVRLRLTTAGQGIFVDIQANQSWSGINGTDGRSVYFQFRRIA